MSGVQQNLTPSEVGLPDLLNLFQKNLLLQFNSHHIAQIQDFNKVQQTASATVNYKKSFLVPDTMGVYSEQLLDYPLMVNMPVIFLGGGDGCLTFPVESGDDCLVCFNDRDLDRWFSGSTTSAPNTSRLHAYADGVVIVGLRRLSEAIPNFSSDSVEMRTYDGLTKISLKTDGSKVTIKVGPTMTMEISATGQWKLLNAAGQDLITTLMNLFLNSTVLGVPIVPSPADFAVLTSFKPI